MAMKEKTCCFTGHRNLPLNKIEQITRNLDLAIENLINEGVSDFISGGAVGFDLIAASLIVAKKESTAEGARGGGNWTPAQGLCP